LECRQQFLALADVLRRGAEHLIYEVDLAGMDSYFAGESHPGSFLTFLPESLGVTDIHEHGIDRLHTSSSSGQQGHNAGVAKDFEELPLFVTVASSANGGR